MRNFVAVGASLIMVLWLTSSIPALSAAENPEPLPLSRVRTFAYQLTGLDASGAVDQLVQSRYDMIIVEPVVTGAYDFDAAGMVRRLKASKAGDGVHRKRVIAYIDIGQAEEWRWYWDGRPTYADAGLCRPAHIAAIRAWAPWVAACDPDGWAGNYPVAFWDKEWKNIVINGSQLGAHLGLYFRSMMEEVIKDGFDGVFLDWVEAWQMEEVIARARQEGKSPMHEMIALIQEIRNYGRRHNPDFIVIQQNSSQLILEADIADLKNAVDAISQESVWWEGDSVDDDWNNPNGYDKPSCCTDYYLTRLRHYKRSGFPVFVCDYALRNAADVYARAAAEGFVAYASRRSLSRLTTTPPSFIDFTAPVIGVSKSVLHFGASSSAGASAPQSVTVSNLGQGALNWSLTSDAPWLHGSPASGSGTRTITISTDATGLNPGSFTGVIAISSPTAANSPQRVTVCLTVYQHNSDQKPFGAFETPANGAIIRGSVAVTGWALDDIGIQNVMIYRQEGPTLHFIGQAALVEGARPDVQAAYPTYPASEKAGWGYMMLSNFLPNNGNGPIILTAIARDITGKQTTLGSTRIECDNRNAVKPFGAIDTPAQGETISGKSFVIHGWALTPPPRRIPINGSTITVYIDNKPVGHPKYNIYRPDVAELFPGYANSQGAHGYYILNTSAWPDGVHSLSWTVRDDAGNEDGIGSRYFIIRNNAP